MKSLVQYLQERKNDKGEEVPKKCHKCGGEIVIQLHGEPVFVCKKCGEYYGTVPFPKTLESLLSDVKSDWSPKEGLFTGTDANKIANYLIKNSKDKAQAMKRLIFYMNRAGENLTNRDTLEKVKDLLKQ